jgi:S1-C subfamily serine protease
MPTPPHGNFVASYLAGIERLALALGGIPVWEVLPSSFAETAGLKFGDIVLTVNCTPTPTFEDFLLAGALHLENLEFTVFRNGQELTLRVDEPVEL